MPLYECVLIARNDVTQQQVETVADTITTDLETDGGAVKKREYWGLRSLAYRVNKNRKGHYAFLHRRPLGRRAGNGTSGPPA